MLMSPQCMYLRNTLTLCCHYKVLSTKPRFLNIIIAVKPVYYVVLLIKSVPENNGFFSLIFHSKFVLHR